MVNQHNIFFLWNFVYLLFSFTNFKHELLVDEAFANNLVETPIPKIKPSNQTPLAVAISLSSISSNSSMAYSNAIAIERHMEIIKNQEFHWDQTQKWNQNKNFYYKNSHMEIKKKKILSKFKYQYQQKKERKKKKNYTRWWLSNDSGSTSRCRDIGSDTAGLPIMVTLVLLCLSPSVRPVSLLSSFCWVLDL